MLSRLQQDKIKSPSKRRKSTFYIYYCKLLIISFAIIYPTYIFIFVWYTLYKYDDDYYTALVYDLGI